MTNPRTWVSAEGVLGHSSPGHRVVRITLGSPTRAILEEIAHKGFTRRHVALTYAMCIEMTGTDDPPDWPMINKAITDRWSVSGLLWIKRRAWKLIENRRGGRPYINP